MSKFCINLLMFLNVLSCLLNIILLIMIILDHK